MLLMLQKPVLMLASLALAIPAHAEPPSAKVPSAKAPAVTRTVELKASNSGLDEITIDLQRLWCVSAEAVASRIYPDRPVKTWTLPPRMNGATMRLVFLVGEVDLKECIGLAKLSKSREAEVSLVIPLSASVGTPPKQTADLGDVQARLKR